MTLGRMLLLNSLSAFLTSCHSPFPNDPEATLQEIIDSKKIIIGTCQTITPQELQLLTDLAQKLNATIQWKNANQEDLYRDLEKHRVNIVSCTINKKSPWGAKVSFTVPYHVEKTDDEQNSYVFALQQGENRWSTYVNEFIKQHKSVE